MDSFWDLFKPEELIRFGGLFLLLVVIFLENGVFFGFFLPGDSLLFTAGLLCYLGVLDVELSHLIFYIGFAAIAGYYAGYWFGYKTGEALYKKEDTLFFKKKYITTAEDFYKKYGGIALVMGRFLPIIRTFAPILAGVVKVRPIIFFLFNVVGAFLWPLTIVTSGYYVGQLIPNALDYLNYVVIAFILVTSIPIYSSFRKERLRKKELSAKKD
ncbi:MAG: DedA family protein [Bacteroidia bacterium]|nr:DedA family protein [Bacteroidia bacterium]MCF8447553.1 DedA family protein [Bacteroidia bacterium]